MLRESKLFLDAFHFMYLWPLQITLYDVLQRQKYKIPCDIL